MRKTGRAQTAFRRFLESARESCSAVEQALPERFEPPAKNDVYAAEFQCRKKDKVEGWEDSADARLKDTC